MLRVRGTPVVATADDSPATDGGPDPELIALTGRVVDRWAAGATDVLDSQLVGVPGRAAALDRLRPALEAMAALRHEMQAETSGVDPAEGRLGDFPILRTIGRGGMGVVYEAVDPVLGRRVALKVLHAAVALDERARLRFELEAQATALLQHPHIVPIHNVGQVQGVPYAVMQLIDGRNLSEVLEALRALRAAGFEPHAAQTDDPTALTLAVRLVEGPLRGTGAGSGDSGPALRDRSHADPAPDSGPGGTPEPSRLAAPRTLSLGRPYALAVAWLGVQAAGALQAAHEQGILHRDIKPANLLLDRAGHLWITDFGLARLPEASGLTRTGDLVGTLPYMSPEQAGGRALPLDQRADVYSLGVTLYELLGLRMAVGGRDRAEVLRRIAQEEPEPLRRVNPAVPADLATIVTRAIARAPGDRYATAGELADDLRRFLDGRPIAARPLGAPARLWRWGRRNPALAGMAALTLALLTALAAGGVAAAYGQRTQRKAAERLRGLAEVRAAQAQQSALEAQAARDRAHHDLQQAIQACKNLALRLDRLGQSPDPQVRQIRDDSFRDAARWCREHLDRVGPPDRWTETDLQVAVLLGPFLAQLGQFDAALTIGAEVRSAGARLHREQPQNPGRVHLYAGSLANLALAQASAGQPEAAAETGAEGDRVLASFLQQHPDEWTLLRLRFVLLGNQAGTLHHLGRRDESLAADLASLPVLEAVRRLTPKAPDVPLLLADRGLRAGFGLLESGRAAEAVERFDAILAAGARLPELAASSDAARRHRRQALEGRARGLSLLGRPAAAAADLEALLDLQADPDGRWLIRQQVVDARILAGQYDTAVAGLEALAVDPEAIATAPLGPARLCAAVLNAPAATTGQRERAAAVACAWLAQARRRGLLDAPEHRDPLLHAPDFQPLRDQPELLPIFDTLARAPLDR